MDAKKPVFSVCCQKMGMALYDGGSAPGIHCGSFPPYIACCDGDLREVPIAFCPWCGKAVETFEQEDQKCCVETCSEPQTLHGKYCERHWRILGVKTERKNAR